LSINNWNEKKKIDSKIKAYEAQLKVELKSDLRNLESIANRISKDKEILRDYVSYYNRKVVNIDTLVTNIRGIDYELRAFTSQAYTIEEIVNNGFLSFLESKKKNAILELQATYNNAEKYHENNMMDLLGYTNAVNKEIDVLNLYGYTNKEHIEVKDWMYDLNSRQMRLYNNEIVGVLYFYDNQEFNHAAIESRINAVLELLE